jgi:GAF domain-containing protein
VGEGPADNEARLLALEQEESVAALLRASAQLLVEALNATACAISRAIGDPLVELAEHSNAHSVATGHGYLISDYPATREVLEARIPMTVAVSDPTADEQEVKLLHELGYDSLLMLPMVCGDEMWGLVEVYDNRDDGFGSHDVDVAKNVVDRACAVLERLSAN